MSIIRYSVFRTAGAKGIDLDDYAERDPKVDSVSQILLRKHHELCLYGLD